jgi:uncharacterized protein YjbI with pentapeptide repeats
MRRTASIAGAVLITAATLTACGGGSNDDLSALDATRLLEEAGVPCDEQDIEKREGEKNVFFEDEEPNIGPDVSVLTCEVTGGGYGIYVYEESDETLEWQDDYCSRTVFDRYFAQTFTGEEDAEGVDFAYGANWVALASEDALVATSDLAEALGGETGDVDSICSERDDFDTWKERGVAAADESIASSLEAEQREREEREAQEAQEQAQAEKRQEALDDRKAAAEERKEAAEQCEETPTAGCVFSNQNYSGRDFSGQDLEGVVFNQTNLDGADFSGAKLSGARFTNNSLNGTTFAGADLSDSRFVGVFFKSSNENVDFSLADLSRAHLNMDYFDQTSFRGAKLNQAITEGQSEWTVDFTDADLTDARVSTGVVEGALGSFGTELENPPYTYAVWSNTTCPSGDVVDDPLDCPIDSRGTTLKRSK